MTIKAGDVVQLKDPVGFGEVDANGQPVAGLYFETSVVVVLTNDTAEGQTVYVAPATMFDAALLIGATVLHGVD
jgi:hypothetical protein